MGPNVKLTGLLPFAAKPPSARRVHVESGRSIATVGWLNSVSSGNLVDASECRLSGDDFSGRCIRLVVDSRYQGKRW